MHHDKIILNHGGGGLLTKELISNLFYTYFKNDILLEQGDSAILNTEAGHLAFTTDSYVVDPIFFPGGNIGKLAVCGTVNDLSVSGAKPLYLSAGFIIEEGLSMNDLEEIVRSMAEEAKKAGVQIVCGDTKVVNRGKCDKVFINTSGIGILEDRHKEIGSGRKIQVGDKIIINGFVGDHGIAVLGARKSLNFQTEIKSDCASLSHIIQEVLAEVDVHFMRDATRGGLATVLNEIAEHRNFGIEINEDEIPVREETQGVCELLGFDPLYLANEGKVVMVVPADKVEVCLSILQNNELAKDSRTIGEIVESYPGKVILKTSIGGRRFVELNTGEQLPRIC
ncbi:MAG: hydrogenase expression/formation protein HypE [Bacteroidales bacterium]|nr:hydrogenase expression/formation protein HypE [Bacteroidales bacterium]MCF8457671.1 hydrogenase expression/formation protein HypE [Bacteroidales bacterium]